MTRDELVGGRRVVAFPADEPHATQHTELDYVLRAHMVSGYHGATDLLADDAVAEALIAKGNPVILGREARVQAEAILKVLAARSIAVSEAQRQEILRCADPARLDRWLLRAAVVSSTGEVMSEP